MKGRSLRLLALVALGVAAVGPSLRPILPAHRPTAAEPAVALSRQLSPQLISRAARAASSAVACHPHMREGCGQLIVQQAAGYQHDRARIVVELVGIVRRGGMRSPVALRVDFTRAPGRWATTVRLP